MSTLDKPDSKKLISFDKNQGIKDFVACNLKVDVGQENLLTFTLNDGKEIVSTFDRKIVHRMNFLGIIDDKTKKHMIIIFAFKETCDKICNIIHRNKPSTRILDSEVEEFEFNEKFFRPLLKAAQMPENVQSPELKAVIQKFINYCDNNLAEKQKYLSMISEMSFFNPISLDDQNGKGNDNQRSSNFDATSDDNDYILLSDDEEDNGKENITTEASMEIGFTNNSIGNVDDDFDMQSHGDADLDDSLMPFSDIGETSTQSINPEKSYNLRKRKLNMSHLMDNDSEEDCESDDADNMDVSFQENCFKTIHKPYFEIKIMKTHIGTDQQYLFIYDEVTKKQISKLTYVNQKKRFLCNGCYSKKNYVMAYLRIDDFGQEYIQMSKKEHVCGGITQNQTDNTAPKLLLSPSSCKKSSTASFRKIHKPYFEITEILNNRRIPKKCLLILDEKTKKPIYKYISPNNTQSFYCHGCHSKRKHVTAYLCKNKKKEEYIQMSNEKHVCRGISQCHVNIKPYKYVQKPNFKIVKTTPEKSQPILIIFDEATKQPISKYVYYDGPKRFVCYGCRRLKKHVAAKLTKNEQEEDCILLINDEHICQPKASDFQEYL